MPPSAGPGLRTRVSITGYVQSRRRESGWFAFAAARSVYFPNATTSESPRVASLASTSARSSRAAGVSNSVGSNPNLAASPSPASLGPTESASSEKASTETSRVPMNIPRSLSIFYSSNVQIVCSSLSRYFPASVLKHWSGFSRSRRYGQSRRRARCVCPQTT